MPSKRAFFSILQKCKKNVRKIDVTFSKNVLYLK